MISKKKKEAIIYSKHPIPDTEISRKVEEAGYGVGIDDSKSWISLDSKNYLDLIVSIAIIFVLYFVALKFVLSNGLL